MIGNAQPLLKSAMENLWIDPDRGNFRPSLEAVVKELKNKDLNREDNYNCGYLQTKKSKKLKYFGSCLSKHRG